jgi:hypothetical protein
MKAGRTEEQAMRIDPSAPQTSLAQTEIARSTAAISAGADAQAAGDLHTLSTDLMQLLSLSGRVPEVRADLLKQVAQRLAAGEYRTHQARDAVVEAILGSQPG